MDASSYRVFIRLNLDGSYSRISPGQAGQGNFDQTVQRLLQEAQQFLERESLTPENITKDFDRTIQRLLMSYLQDESVSSTDRWMAELCLRCYISHRILFFCTALERKFYGSHSLTRGDVIGFVLTDNNPTQSIRTHDRYKSLIARKVLDTFDPTDSNQLNRASLATWTNRLASQDKNLNLYLQGFGIYSRSEWGTLLEWARISQPEKFLSSCTMFPEDKVQTACALLKIFDQVYGKDRRDRKQRSKCLPPTPELLEEMVKRFNRQMGSSISAAALNERLQNLGEYLRQYRMNIENPSEIPVGFEPVQPVKPDSEFRLEEYREIFAECLRQAIKTTIADRLQRESSLMGQRFLKVLQLYYCCGEIQEAIAAQLGIDQPLTNKLLNRKAFLSRIQQETLGNLKQRVLKIAEACKEPDHLEALSDLLKEYLKQAAQRNSSRNAEKQEQNDLLRIFDELICEILRNDYGNLADC